MTESTVERIAAAMAALTKLGIDPDIQEHLLRTGALTANLEPLTAEIDRLTAERDAARAEVERLREALSDVSIRASRFRELLHQAQAELEAWYPGSGFAATIRTAIQPNPASWGAAGVKVTITEPEGSHVDHDQH